MGYKETQIWQRTLAARENDRFDKFRERLRSVYEKFWERGASIAQRISSDLPDLTLHDVIHLEALWDRADQLTNNNYEINPLEVFVLGGAIILHDIGHALTAYSGGLKEVEETSEYKDALTSILKVCNFSEIDTSKVASSEEKRSALLRALRRLHAKQAEQLASQSFDGQYLIDDSDLRASLAQIIGQVAASHHLDRAYLDVKLPSVQGSPGSLPQEWQIQPLKLACLLRCADAIQIDQRRASTFSQAIQRPSKLSRLHWDAQQIAQPFLQNTEDSPTSLTFTSQNSFSKEDADAWWISYDLIKNADSELNGCYHLMKSKKLPVFTVDRVSGATDPLRLSEFIRTSGWRPVPAEIKVTNADQIVRLFGGEALYGRDLAVPLRELIQNAADAVRARRFIANDPNYEGRITVTLQPGKSGASGKLTVTDDGIGMGQQILTGPLIEFGKSFWTSSEVQDLYPGLISSGIRQGGKFGIGFFSTFIIAQEVKVTSRRFDRSEGAYTLHFRGGHTIRPILLEADNKNLGQATTQVELTVTNANLNELLSCRRIHGLEKNIKLTIDSLVAHIAPCLDCDIFTAVDLDKATISHSRTWYEQDALVWLRKTLFAEDINDSDFDGYLNEAAPLLEILYDDENKPCGRAAIGFAYIGAGIELINGLISGSYMRNFNGFSKAFIGAMASPVDGPSRIAGKRQQPEETISKWATHQSSLFKDYDNKRVKYAVSTNVANFFGDPTTSAVMIINREIIDIDKIYERLEKEEIFAVVKDQNYEGLQLSMLTYELSPHSHLGFKPEEIEFSKVTLEALGWPNSTLIYHQIRDPNDLSRYSFMGCLSRYAKARGAVLCFERISNMVLARFIGLSSNREKLYRDQDLIAEVIRIYLRS